jgi:estrogen-related receptor beta like 1
VEGSRRRRERDDAGGVGGGDDPDAPNPFGTFILAENLMDKLKLLGYDDQFCRQRKMQPVSR